MRHEGLKTKTVIIAFIVGIVVAGIVVFTIMFIGKNKSAPIVISGQETVSGLVAIVTDTTKDETGKSVFSMEKGWIILGILLGLAMWIYILAGYGIFVSFIKSGEIILVEMGKSFYKLIPNIPGYGVLDNKIAKIDYNGAKKPKSVLGIFWIGLYPIWKIHKYPLKWDKSISESEKTEEEKKGGTIDETYFGLISHRKEVVSSVRHKNSVPVVLKDIELTKQLKIDIYFDVIFESVDPVFFVFMLNGNWFPLAVSAFSGIISDFLRGVELRKISGCADSAVRSFEEIDKVSEFDKTVSEKNDIIINASGMRVAQTVYKDYVIAGEPEAKKAMEGLVIAELNAQIKEKEGEGDGAKIKKIKAAEAEGLEMILKAALRHPSGGEIVKEQLRAERLKNFAGNTLVEGNPTTPVLATLPIPADNKDKKKSDQKKEEENA